MFISIQGGDYIINTSQIAYIESEPGAGEITLYMSNGQKLTVDDADEKRRLYKTLGMTGY